MTGRGNGGDRRGEEDISEMGAYWVEEFLEAQGIERR